MLANTNSEDQEIMRRGPAAPLLSHSPAASGTVKYRLNGVQMAAAQLGNMEMERSAAPALSLRM